MAKYSFYVRDKETGQNLYSKNRHPLQFLDFFASQFNNKEELMRFLGVNPEKYDEIGILYKVSGEVKNLKVYFDSLELEEMSRSVINLPFPYTSLLIKERMALGYVYPRLITYANIIPESDATKEITRRISIPGFADKAYLDGLLDAKTLEYYEKGEFDRIPNHLLKHYLLLRRVYEALRNDYYLIASEDKMNQTSNITMKEIIDTYNDSFNANFYKKLMKVNLSLDEQILIGKALIDSDEEAYELLKASPTERLEVLNPIIDYISKKRGNVKKIGPSA